MIRCLSISGSHRFGIGVAVQATETISEREPIDSWVVLSRFEKKGDVFLGKGNRPCQSASF
jgi:hypothetical protein